MIALRLPTLDQFRLRKRINRAPSPVLARGVPWLTVMLGSLLPSCLVIASAPVLPPFGFLMLLGWRQLRPGLLPVWAGLPLGFFDDLYNGQPFGTATMLWSVAMLALDAIEARFPWRGFALEWLVAAAMILLYVPACLALANLAGATSPLAVTVPQLLLAILVYPVVGRIVAISDRFRLLPIVDLG
jgi:rod shape-determining protein MreD